MQLLTPYATLRWLARWYTLDLTGNATHGEFVAFHQDDKVFACEFVSLSDHFDAISPWTHIDHFNLQCMVPYELAIHDQVGSLCAQLLTDWILRIALRLWHADSAVGDLGR